MQHMHWLAQNNRNPWRRSHLKNVVPNSPRQEGSKEQTLLTPVSVPKLKETLLGHPHNKFVTQLMNDFTQGVHMAFQRVRTLRFSKTLATASAKLEVVSANLANEVSLGNMTGSFEDTHFQNSQVSPISLVSKKNSNKFRTIFHISYPTSGSTSINCSISKGDFSLQYFAFDFAINGIKRVGQNCFLANTDIEAAFRQIATNSSGRLRIVRNALGGEILLSLGSPFRLM